MVNIWSMLFFYSLVILSGVLEVFLSILKDSNHCQSYGRKILYTFSSVQLLFQHFAQEQTTEKLPLKYRNIGPYRGGKISHGNRGSQWHPWLFFGTNRWGSLEKDFRCRSTGKISQMAFFYTWFSRSCSVSESQPKHPVYVGMGEHAPRGVMTSLWWRP